MNARWNTRKFRSYCATALCEALNKVGTENIVLLVQPRVLPTVNALLTFSQLTSSTAVTKIIILEGSLENDIRDILSSMPEANIAFLVDLRVDLTLPSPLVNCPNLQDIPVLNVVYASWSTQMSNQLTSKEGLHHHICSQLQTKYTHLLRLFEWDTQPFTTLDDNILSCDLLYNTQGQNMYWPVTNSMLSATREILIDNMVNAIQSLLSQTGANITHSVAIGPYSKTFVHLLQERLQYSKTLKDLDIERTLFGNKHSSLETDLIVIERDADPLTPLLTQLTYAGLLDDLYGYLPEGKLSKGEDVLLNYLNDDIWDELKFLNFGALGPKLNTMAKELQEKYDSRHSAESVGEIKEFVDSMGSLQQRQQHLKTHTALSSNILKEVEGNRAISFNDILELEQDILLNNLDHVGCVNRIQNMIYESQVDRNRILRIICLFSLCKNGIKDRDYETLKTDLVDTFGLKTLFLLEKLARNHFFLSKSMVSKLQKINTSLSPDDKSYTFVWSKEYHFISTWLNTLPEDNNNTQDPNDAKVAYCGMVPLTMRLIQLCYDRSTLLKHYSAQQPFVKSKEPSLTKTEQLFTLIYGRHDTVEEKNWYANIQTKRKTIGQTDKDESDIVLLVFIGGITMGEITTIKYLQKELRLKKIKKRFIIVCDGFINGEKLITSIG